MRGELFYKTCPVKIDVCVTIVQFPLQVFIFSWTESIINPTLHLSKDQPEDGPKIGPKHVSGFIK